MNRFFLRMTEGLGFASSGDGGGFCRTLRNSLQHCARGSAFLVKMSAARVVMGRAKRGLYAGRHIQFGNQVSEDGGNKSRRTWKPNVQTKRIFSLGLDRYIRVSITMHALRCIDKAGGLDEYLLTTPEHKLDNDMARDWRRRIAAVYYKLYNTEIATLTVKPGMEDQLPRHLQARTRGLTLEQLNALEGRSAS